MPALRIDPVEPEPGPIARAAELIRGGGLVAFPTETVYGLGANAFDEAAVRRVFEAKGRPSYNPLIVHVPDAESARRLVRAWPEAAERLAAAFWPGPLTLVLRKRPVVPDIVSAGLPSVAVRVPAHPVALALLRAAAVPIVAPSANPSSALSPTRAEHVERGLGDRVDLILDAGPARVGIESTVLDLTGSRPVLLRPGILSTDALEPIVGPIERVTTAGGTAPRAAPGMLERHYAPRATLRVFEPEARGAAAAVAREAAGRGESVGALVFEPIDAPVEHLVRMPRDPAAYAGQLYADLHRLDALGCDLILAEQVPDSPAWDGARDRLRRAATPDGA